MIPSFAIKNLTFSFNKKDNLFSNLDLTFPNVPIIGIIGKNGIGKTVLAEILVGKYKIASGEILLFGKDISNLPTSKRSKKINLSFQKSSFAFFKETIIAEVLLVINNNYKSMNKEAKIKKAKKLLNSINLGEKANNNPLTLSGGEKRLLSFLILDIMNPYITIYDEPTIGLDKIEKQELKKRIFEKVHQNKRTIIITHDIKFLAKITNYMILLNENSFTKKPEVAFMGKIFDFYISGLNKSYKFLPELSIFTKFISIVEKNKKKDLDNFLALTNDYEVFNHIK
ncbi:MAG: Energy-coupling factor transporter ATP-binding protein EcfA2 [Candidatus Heimdallarchaeota archaeon LC_3]|nr:MAG: Energy-coupling factor transporter ATP-binding protein EcfA2 [Candidatus Heimdallarchaeota archaeon LC_3]